MEISTDVVCPRCTSEKFTSLPFGYIIRAVGSAKTYRCLVCGNVFVKRIRFQGQIDETEVLDAAVKAASVPLENRI